MQRADSTGFLYLGVCDHLAIPRPSDEQMGTEWYDTVATLGWIAALTENVRLLSHVYVLSYRHPLQTAKAFMTLDELSGGRVILGVGAGHLQREFELLGVDFEARGRTTEAAIEVIRAAFADEYPRVDGPWGPIADAGLAPRPRQDPIPIWVGGSSRVALRRAARLADGWIPQGTPREEMPAKIGVLLAERQALRSGDPIEICCLTEPLYVGEPGWDVGERALAGHSEYLVERLNELGAMGVDHLQVRFRTRGVSELLDQMEAFASSVAPHLTRVPISTDAASASSGGGRDRL